MLSNLITRRSLTPSSLSRSSLTLRTIWTTSTFVSTNPHSLLLKLQATPLPPSDVTLYTLSKNTPSSDIEAIQSHLQSIGSGTSTEGVTVIGCLSELLPSHFLPSSPLLHSTRPTKQQKELFSLSLASFSSDSPTSRAIPFTSSLTGRRNIAVGREIKSSTTTRMDVEGRGDGETVDGGFEAFLSGGKWGFGEGPKEGVKGTLEELKGIE